MIAIIDYDAGNIKSVEKALAYLGEEVRITRACVHRYHRASECSCSRQEYGG